MRFRPCIDLHEGKVKQIVGESLGTGRESGDGPVTNFSSENARAASELAAMYRRDGLRGGHVIMLGPGNEDAAISALNAYPGGLQIGGGIDPANAPVWLEHGADKVIVTSYMFVAGRLNEERLGELRESVEREHLVLDLSCRNTAGDRYTVTADRWKTMTKLEIDPGQLEYLADFCSEFLVHAVDHEGRRSGIEKELVKQLAEWSPVPVTYAGGVRDMSDILTVEKLGKGRVDLTVGSALDIFGGDLKYEDLVSFDRRQRRTWHASPL